MLMATEKIALLQAILPESPHLNDVINHVVSNAPVPPQASVQLVSKTRLANSLAELTGNNQSVVEKIINKPGIETLRDVAFHVGPQEAAELAGKSSASGGNSLDIEAFQKGIYQAEPAAVIHRLVNSNQIRQINLPAKVRSGVSTFLDNNKSFNMRQAPVTSLLNNPGSLGGIEKDRVPKVVDALKTIQRVHALSPDPQTLSTLLNQGVKSAHSVSQIPQSTFVDVFKDTLGVNSAKQIHDHAMVSTNRNDQVLTQIYQTIKGAGIAAIDGVESVDTRMSVLRDIARKNNFDINLEALFGGLDYCDCDDCTNVYSPANYFVELLQYLRNNTLDSRVDSNNVPLFPNTSDPTFNKTALDVLLKRRPDLQHLQLTCANANTLIPYVDLANEVMESFIVHQDAYPATWSADAQSDIDVFNVHDETSSELLAEAQHTNYQAYCILLQAVYPLGILPFHQPITAIRIYLNFLQTSRYEVINTFVKPYATPTTGGPYSPSDDAELRKLEDEVIHRAVAAEFLSIVQEEYVILTKEAFYPKAYFEITTGNKLGDDEYQKKIGVKETRDYWGYKTDDLMLDNSMITKTGLQFAKAQFLKRSGMTYAELVDLVKTGFVNPVYPSGNDLLIFQSLHFSYRFLQNSLVNKNATNKRDKFKLLIEFLDTAQPWAEKWIKKHDVDQDETCTPDISRKEIAQFVYRWFDCLADIVVLESEEGPTLPTYGIIIRYDSNRTASSTATAKAVITNSNTEQPTSADPLSGVTIIGTLYSDGTITDGVTGDGTGTGTPQGNILGEVAIDSKVYDTNGQPFMKTYGASGELFVIAFDTSARRTFSEVAMIDKDSSLQYSGEDMEGLVRWNAVVDSCDIETVRILHLDGTSLSVLEWDRIQRFVRLWKKIGWSIVETDEALSGGSTNPPTSPVVPPDSTVSLNDFAADHCEECNGDIINGDCDCNCDCIPEDACKDAKKAEITPDFISQLASMRKLQDSTGIELAKLLALWADVGPSLYTRLFLTHNLLGIDPVFKGDSHGNFLITATKIADHVPVILAALRLKLDGLSAILSHLNLQDGDLTLKNISAIYRYALLSQTLLIKPSLFIEAIDVFGDPFQDATATLNFVTLFHKITDAGFNVQQIGYVIKGEDDPAHPLAPQTAKILKTAKTIFDGLTDIDSAHPDVTFTDDSPPNTDDVSKVLVLLYQPDLASQITSLLEGTTVYSTNAPSGLTIKVPTNLTPKISYADSAAAAGTPKRGKLTVIGILTDDEKAQAKGLSTSSGWADAIDRVGKQALSFFKNNLSPIFPDATAAMAALLAGDVVNPVATSASSGTTPDTAPQKRLFFLKFFVPYLRSQLEDQLIIATMAAETGLPTAEITTALLNGIITVSGSAGEPSQSAMTVLRGLKNQPSAASGWSGYLIPQSSDTYTFVGIGNSRPQPLVFDGAPVPFDTQQDDPNDVWFTAPIALTGGRLYRLATADQSVPGLQWNTSRAAITNIPSSALLPDFSTAATTKVFGKLERAAIVVKGFQLTINEINYFQAHKTDFASFDLDSLTWDAFQRIMAYVGLRDTVSGSSDFDLISLFKWASTPPRDTPPTAGDIAGQINKATQWVKDDVQTLIGPDCFNLVDISTYRNEIALIKLQSALTIERKIAVDIPKLFKWANPMAKFSPSRAIAQDIHNSIRARYSLDDWEQAAQPLHNQLRMAQRDALVAYLVVLDALTAYGVVDADSLFEFFLIDVQMGACLTTSRLKQAISTVQTFVQRCILGLEEEHYPDIKNNSLDQKRWMWMSKQTIWTANRKVFLYPELYTIPSLRDDKSSLYKSLENELLQKDISAQNLQDALKNYLFELDQVSNLLVEGIYQDDKDKNNHTTYLVAKTRSAPYLFFYRSVATSYGAVTWTPWQPIPVDIPTYHVDALDIAANAQGNKNSITLPASDGSYLIPFFLGKRFLLFFGQMTLKSSPQTALKDLKLPQPGDSAETLVQYQTWEIKLGWSELRNGQWSHKQSTVDSIMEKPSDIVAPPLDMYTFIPYTRADKLADGTSVDYILIGVYNQKHDKVGGFEFHGSQVFVSSANIPDLKWDVRTSFHFAVSKLSDWTPYASSPPTIYSLQNPGDSFNPTQRPYVQYPLDAVSTSTLFLGFSSVPFYHKFSHSLLDEANQADDLNPIFSTYQHEYSSDKDAFGAAGHDYLNGKTYLKFNELAMPYSLYNWEVGFHAPMELADALLRSQKFDDALSMAHYVFNPYADGKDETRVWQWSPFADVNTASLLEALFNQLQPHTPDDVGGPINSWRNNPFAPHVVARGRPVAYMKWTVMTYLRILIEYGDWYFRQNSLEAIPLALQCYILASHIYGPAAQRIPKRGVTKPQTYFSLLDKWDAFSNAVVDLELAFPFSNQSPHPVEFRGNEIALANIFGFATTHYFCVPDNPQLRDLRDLINDRLYKIRHCQDINGNAISLALWDPPIDPALLVSATAQGLSLSSFLNDLNSPMPNYRFFYLLQKALELCAELKSMGAAFLTIKEKRDSEALQLLKGKQDLTIQGLTMEVRNLQLEEANKTIDALRASRNAPLYRYRHYASLAGAPVATLLETDTTYKEIDMTIPAPTTDGDLVLTDSEKNEMDEAQSAKDKNDVIGPVEVTAGGLLALPIVSQKVTPWGLGVGFAWGPNNFAQAGMAFARYMRIQADEHTFNSTNSGRKVGNIKQHQDRVQSANSAGYEALNINNQIQTQISHIKSVSQEITNQQAVIANAQETLDFLQSKYTNDDLYRYLEDTVRTVFKQTYNMAYELGKKAEAAFMFERGPQAAGSSPFIQFGYFDPSRDGLQSGERLYMSLKQLEAAYIEKRGHDFEVTKMISLRQINPFALLKFRATGTCEFDLPEVLFDMDFPGHYFRRIRTVNVTVPCIVGPYTSISATLRLLKHTYRTLPTGASDAGSYAQKPSDGPDGPDNRFSSSSIPIDSIAVSTAMNDAGVFELSLSSDRYLPFEGAGAISTWQLDLPTALHQFDYTTITDVVLAVRYTSLNGGDKLKAAASASVSAYVASVENLSRDQGLFAVFDLQSDFASDWARAVAGAAPGAADPNARTLPLTNIADRLPVFTRGRAPENVLASDVAIMTETDLPAGAYGLSTGAGMDVVTFTEVPDAGVGAVKVFRSGDGIDRPFGGPGVAWSLAIEEANKTVLKRIWLVIRYVLH